MLCFGDDTSVLLGYYSPSLLFFHPASIQLAEVAKLNRITNSSFHTTNACAESARTLPTNAAIANNFASTSVPIAVILYHCDSMLIRFSCLGWQASIYNPRQKVFTRPQRGFVYLPRSLHEGRCCKHSDAEGRKSASLGHLAQQASPCWTSTRLVRFTGKPHLAGDGTPDGASFPSLLGSTSCFSIVVPGTQILVIVNIPHRRETLS